MGEVRNIEQARDRRSRQLLVQRQREYAELAQKLMDLYALQREVALEIDATRDVLEAAEEVLASLDGIRVGGSV